MSRWSDSSIFAKLAAGFSIALVLGLGLCGLDIVLMEHGFRKSNEEFGGGPLDGLSLIVMILSVLGLVITVVAWILAAFVSNLRSARGGDEPQRLFDPKDKDG